MKARKRLEESKFHLDKLIESNDVDLSQFEVFLNSYITSARSVIWILKSDCSHDSDLKRLYDSLEFTGEEDEIIKRITDLRNKSQKQSPIEVDAITYHFQVDLGELEGEVSPEPVKRYYSIESSHEDIEETCVEYYSILEKYVKKFEAFIENRETV